MLVQPMRRCSRISPELSTDVSSVNYGDEARPATKAFAVGISRGANGADINRGWDDLWLVGVFESDRRRSASVT